MFMKYQFKKNHRRKLYREKINNDLMALRNKLDEIDYAPLNLLISTAELFIEIAALEGKPRATLLKLRQNEHFLSAYGENLSHMKYDEVVDIRTRINKNMETYLQGNALLVYRHFKKRGFALSVYEQYQGDNGWAMILCAHLDD